MASRNGAAGVSRLLRALQAQPIRADLELIVVDDGSADGTGEVARAAGAVVVRHEMTRGVSAARNSGVRVASAPLVAFLDDDCEPGPHWAQAMLAGHGPGVLAVGGPLPAGPGPGLMLGFLSRNNPLDPLELDLARSDSRLYRLGLYLRQQWARERPAGRRPVYAMAAANLSVRRHDLAAVGGFDERIRFGSEDSDLCYRLTRAFPERDLVFEPAAWAVHHFEPSLTDTLRRHRAYGAGSALMYHKWPDVGPAVFPFPAVVLATLGAAVRFPALLGVAVLLPHVCYPRGLRTALATRQPTALLDAYLQLAREASDNVGFAEGWWRFRAFGRDPYL